MHESTVKSGKVNAIVGYLTIFGSIIAIFMNMESKNPFARFHIRQAFGIFAMFYIVGVIISYFNTWLISTPFYVFFFVLWCFGFVNCLKGETKPVPFIGEKFQEWFTFIQ